MNYFAIFLLLAISLTSCSREKSNQTRAADRLIFKDDLGRSVILEKTPERLISFAPNVTEMIFALGAGNKLVGVTAWCNYPAQTKGKTVVGDAVSANLETIISLRSDLAIMVGSKNTPLLAKLEALKIPVLVLDPTDFKGIIGDIRLLSQVLGKEATGDSLILAMKNVMLEIETAMADIPNTKRPSVFAEISSLPLMSAGKNSLIGHLIMDAGGRNLTADIDQDYAAINPESVIEKNPDIILILHPQTDRDQLSRRLGWSNISAVKNKRVFDGLDMDILLRAGPRYVLGVKMLYKLFYEN